MAILYGAMLLWWGEFDELLSVATCISFGAALCFGYTFYLHITDWSCARSLSWFSAGAVVCLTLSLTLATVIQGDPTKQSAVLFIAGMLIMAQTGVNFGMNPRSHFLLFLIPLCYFLVSGLTSYWVTGTEYLASNTLLLSWELGLMAHMASLLAVDQDITWRRNLKTLRATEAEAARLDGVLALLFPPTILAQLKDSGEGGGAGGDSWYAEEHPQCSVLFCDVVNLADLSTTMEPEDLTFLLNDVFCALDALVEEAGCFKVETGEPK